MWLIILGVIVAALIAGVVYMVIAVGRFGGIKALAADRKWLKNVLSLACIALAFLIVSFAKLSDRNNPIRTATARQNRRSFNNELESFH